MRYNDFMEKFYGRQTPVPATNRSGGQDKIANGFQRYAEIISPSTNEFVNLSVNLFDSVNAPCPQSTAEIIFGW